MTVMIVYLDSIDGFVHAVSPVKKGARASYFNLTIQTKDEPRRAVCFSPDKHNTFKQFETAKCAVNLSNVENSKQGKDLLINKRTKLKAINAEEMGFEYNTKLSSKGFVRISDIFQLAPEQIVNVKAHVLSCSDVTHSLRGNETLAKKETILVDQSGFIKTKFFGDDCDAVEEGNSYQMKNLRIKVVHNFR